VGRLATAWIFLAVGALLLAGLVSPQPLAFANTSASVLESFGAANASSGSSSLSASPTAATGAGDLLVAVIRTRNITVLAPVSTVADSAIDTWTRATSKSQGSGDEEIWYAASAHTLSTSQSVTVTVSGTAAASTAIAFTVLDVSGAAASSPLDVAATNAATGTAASTGTTAITAQASEIAISDIAWNTSAITVSGQTAGYTVLPTQTSKVSSDATGEQGAWLLLSTTGAQSYSATLSASAAWAGAIATFKTGTPAPPTITGFNPGTGPVGTPVTITGTNFTGATAVTFFNGVAASYTVTDSQHISTTVPAGATTGVIKVTAGGLTATSSTSFTVTTPPPPTITSFSPTTGPVGTPVTITGTNFTGASAVTFFNAVGATYTVTDSQHISTTVPAGASTGVIKVTVGGVTATSSTNFTVTAPSHPPHIMLIVDENKDYTSLNLPPKNQRYIYQNPQAPYLNQLMTQYASATNWYSLAHPSFKNYLGLLSGQTLGNIPHSSETLADQLTQAGIPWAAYMGGLKQPPNPSSCDPNAADQENYNPPYYDTSPNFYEWDHNPFWWYTGVTGNPAECNSVVPYPGSTSLLSTLNSSNPPDFIEISPNGCDDGHDNNNPPNGPGSQCQYGETEEADLFFQGPTNLEGVTPTLGCPTDCLNLPAILTSSWYQSGGIIIITWDEAPNTDGLGGGLPNTDGGQIATIVISADSHGAYTPAGNDYGILRAIDEQYGLTPLANAANAANGDLRGAFTNAGTVGSISGTVLDSVTTLPVVGANVTCTGTPTCTPTTTGAGGAYTLNNLAPGTYTVQVSATNYGTQSATDTVTSGAAPPDNFNLIPNPGSITGTVTDSVTGVPISGASVTCTGTSTCTPTSTAGDGTYTLSNLTEGSYTVTFAANQYGSQSPNVNVSPGGTTTESPVLVPNTGSISGVVSDSVSGNPISSASVSCTGTPTCTGTTTGSDGSYLLSPLAEGNYSVTVSATGYKSQTKVVVVGPGGTPTQPFLMVVNTASLGLAQSFGSANSGSTGGTTLTATTTTQTGSGDLLVLTIKTRSTPVTVTGITDNALPANTWTKATGVVSGQADEEIWYASNAGSVTSVTVTVSGTTSMAMTIADVTGASATTPRDQFATSSGSVVPPQPSTGVTAATTQSNEIVIGDIGWNNTATLSGLAFTPPTTINLLPTQSSSVTSLKTSEQMAWQVVSTTHTQTLAGTLSGSFAWTGAIATFH
jgi:hypothetical protein